MITQEDRKRFEELLEQGDGNPRDKEALRILLRAACDFFNDVSRIADALNHGKGASRGKF
jgi:hypothetical protein